MKTGAAEQSATNKFLDRPVGVRKEHHSKKREEMRLLYARLKDLVPGVPRDRKLSNLEIIQNAIDYIAELEIAVKTHPATTYYSSRAAETSASAVRQPFGVLPPSSNVITSSARTEQATTSGKMQSHLDELTPVLAKASHGVCC